MYTCEKHGQDVLVVIDGRPGWNKCPVCEVLEVNEDEIRKLRDEREELEEELSKMRAQYQ